jgi:Rieske Fe-S protein
MAAISFALGIACILGRPRLYSLAPIWAAGVLILQLGDLITAPAYNMTIAYFGAYLFSLPAYDALLILQVIAIVAYRSGPSDRAKPKRGAYFEAVDRKQRRDFLRIMSAIGSFFVLAVVLVVLDLTAAQPTGTAQGGSTTSGSQSSSQTSSTGGGGSQNAVANVGQLQVGTPFYFSYPDSRHPNALFKRADGSVQAYSLLCTHVCCTVNFNSASNTFLCPCHSSLFGSTGEILRGPATYPLPKVTLQVDSSGNITPTGISGTSPCA